jgi:hypothetical protein
LAVSQAQKSLIVGTPFPIRFYTMFEGSVRKNNSVNWKQEYLCGFAVISRSDATYNLCIYENINDGLYHDDKGSLEPDSISQEIKKFENGFSAGQHTIVPCSDIIQIYYTTSGNLLNIQESVLPVLVLKTRSSQTQANSTPGPKKIQWIALELNRDGNIDTGSNYSDSDSSSSETEQENSSIIAGLKSLSIKPKKVLETPKIVPLGQLCLLEYTLKLCNLEIFEGKSHLDISEKVVLECIKSKSTSSTTNTVSENLDTPLNNRDSKEKRSFSAKLKEAI